MCPSGRYQEAVRYALDALHINVHVSKYTIVAGSALLKLAEFRAATCDRITGAPSRPDDLTEAVSAF